MAKAKKLEFRDKLTLNQWLISLLGIDPLDGRFQDVRHRPFHELAANLQQAKEGIGADGLHNFYHLLIESYPNWDRIAQIPESQILRYEENIVRYTKRINEKRRQRPVVWKYFQWLSLLFTEIYFDRFFSDKEKLCRDLNEYIDRFNRVKDGFANIPPYAEDDLNKICIQNATGSGKTLLMHINYLQYLYYANLHHKDISRTILLTTNSDLSLQHLDELTNSGLGAITFSGNQSLFNDVKIDINILEITKLADKQGPDTIATRSLGDENLLLVDEGHRGMSGTQEGAWFSRRAALSARGFTVEYSATFDQAVAAAKDERIEDSYAKSILFDYSYRWFYEDGYGKDYQILNLPKSFDEVQTLYMTACLLKYYQQLAIYEDRQDAFTPFNIEKPLWVFVGSTVSSARGTNDEKVVSTDIALILEFIADFLKHPGEAKRRIKKLLKNDGRATGLLDENDHDIFQGAFNYLLPGSADVSSASSGQSSRLSGSPKNLLSSSGITNGKSKGVSDQDNQIHNADSLSELPVNPDTIYSDILTRVFNSELGGDLILSRTKGDSGEILLETGSAEKPFGLINVGNAKDLCDHILAVASQKGIQSIQVKTSDFSNSVFASVKDSKSPVNLLIGSKKFVEGWDCWRVSTLGLMHVGRSEGAQIIQLFGRGVRLKGYDWTLKRSNAIHGIRVPKDITELETLQVFGIEADFMDRFRKFLAQEGLPGNDRNIRFTIPLNVTYDVGKGLKMLRPKINKSTGRPYDFRRDGRSFNFEDGLTSDMSKVKVDWYPRIASIQSQKADTETVREQAYFAPAQLSMLRWPELYYDLQQYKREKGWYNICLSTEGIKKVLQDRNWYELYLPDNQMNPSDYSGIQMLQQVALELLKKFMSGFWHYSSRAFIEPRFELCELTRDDDNFPTASKYELMVDSSETRLIEEIKSLMSAMATSGEYLRKMTDPGSIKICKWNTHLFQPLFHVRGGGKIIVTPVSLNEYEFRFVEDLKVWCDANKKQLKREEKEIFLLRNMSRGKGVGFFEAGGFYPDFILWILDGNKQSITFIDPHGLRHEGIESEKVKLFERLKDIQENRLGDPNVTLTSFILSVTPYQGLKSQGQSKETWEANHVLFMHQVDSTNGEYVGRLFE
ncbi:MAG: DEAD/DEAH box helicase family protein [Planctomycetia bacterium]|nr:DEAD/DEAH box helicase family protein [Planctomycetia bacterium]